VPQSERQLLPRTVLYVLHVLHAVCIFHKHHGCMCICNCWVNIQHSAPQLLPCMCLMCAGLHIVLLHVISTACLQLHTCNSAATVCQYLS
jgi:hypothetical protein